MSDANKALTQRFFEGVNGGRIDEVVEELVSDDFVEHEENPPGFPETSSDKEGVRVFFRTVADAFDGLRFDVEGVISEGEAVAVRSRMRGTHTGEFMGIPATNKPVDIEVIDWVVIRDGKAVEHWGVTDVASMMVQLGAMEGAPA
jgi:steroid delta-isomerase-like uncharacterized protein